LDKRRLSLAFAGLVAVLTGCSSGSSGLGVSRAASDPAANVKVLRSGDPISGNVRFFGYLDIIRLANDDSQEMEARFGRFDAEVPAGVVRDAFDLEAPDTCETSSRVKPIEIVDELAFPGHPYQIVDAGDAIRINHRSRRYASLSRDTGDDGPAYVTAMSGLKATFAKIKLFSVFVRTANLTAVVPGAVFPKMGPLKIPAVSEVDGLNLEKNDRVSADTVFEWDAGDDPGALVQISAGGGGRAVFCSAVDDGEFALPADIRQWLGDNTIPNPEVSRESILFYQTKDALVAVSQSTAY